MFQHALAVSESPLSVVTPSPGSLQYAPWSHRRHTLQIPQRRRLATHRSSQVVVMVLDRACYRRHNLHRDRSATHLEAKVIIVRIT